MRFYISSEKKINKQFTIDHKDLGPIEIKATIVDASKLYLIAKRQDSDHYSYYSRSLKRCTYKLGNADVFATKELAEKELEVIKATKKGFKSFTVSSLDNHYVNNWEITQDTYAPNYKLSISNELVSIEEFKLYSKGNSNRYYRSGEASSIEEAIETHIANIKSNIEQDQKRLEAIEKEKLEALKRILVNKKRSENINELPELEQLSNEFTGGREKVVRMLHGKV